MINYGTKKSGLKPKGAFVELELEKVFTGVQTEKAIRVKLDGNEYWLAKSKIVDLGNGKIKVPRWMLIKSNQGTDDVKSSNPEQPKPVEGKKEEEEIMATRSSEETQSVMKSIMESNCVLVETLNQLIQDNNRVMNTLVLDNNQFLNKLIQENERNLNKLVQLIYDLGSKLLNQNDGFSREEKSVDKVGEEIIKAIEKDLKPDPKETTKDGDMI